MATFYLPVGPYASQFEPVDLTVHDREEDFVRELGGRGLHQFSGYLSEEFLQELTGNRGAKYFEQMRRNDPAIGAMVMAITMLIRSSQASVSIPVPKSDQKKSHEKAAEWYQTVIEDMVGRPEDWKEDGLTAVTHGFSLAEIVFKERNGEDSDFNDGKIGIREVSPRSQLSLERWEFDKHDKVVGFWHRPRWNEGEVFIPIRKTVHIRTMRERDNPEGYSFLRNSVRAYKQVNVIQYAEGIGAERSLAGLPMVRMPVGATSNEDYIRARNLVERARRDEYAGIVLPPAKSVGEDFRWNFELISSHNVGSGLDTDKIIRRLHSEMLVSMLINFVSFGSGGEGGSYAVGRVQGDFFQVAVSGFLDSMEYEINQKISKKLFTLNKFPGLKPNEYPIIKFSPISQRNMEAVRNLVRDMASIGFLDNQGVDIENWLRGQLDLPPITEDDLKKRLEEQEIASKKALEHQQELARITVPPGADTKPKDIAKIVPPANPTVEGAPGTRPPRDQKNTRSQRDSDGPTAGMK